MLYGELIVLARMAGPTRRDPRLEVGWVLADPGEGSHPFLQTEGRHVEGTRSMATLAEPTVLPE